MKIGNTKIVAKTTFSVRLALYYARDSIELRVHFKQVICTEAFGYVKINPKTVNKF